MYLIRLGKTILLVLHTNVLVSNITAYAKAKGYENKLK